MTADQAIDAIYAIFRTAWINSGQDGSLIKYTDVAGEKPAGELTWARVTVAHATGNQSTLAGGNGTRRFRNVGTVTIQIFTPIGDGSVAEYGTAQAILSAYRRAQDVEVWFRNVRLREMPSDGAFAQTNVLSEFTYDDVI